MTAGERPPLELSLTWERDLLFSGYVGEHRMHLDCNSKDGVSPVQALGFALASCMGSDVALILTRGRHPLRALRAHLTAHRAPSDPRRFVSVALRFDRGEVIDLSLCARPGSEHWSKRCGCV